ncbi:hypothetical protein MRB53_025585 [Persea americana]|uniref:Uncharacterized protein n=1 Tax=Persea americana TaxID=3435 RepID=A0ACC2LGS9_PERAE|nr:hypothetical protein MRB53_025585 [Persea americana]
MKSYIWLGGWQTGCILHGQPQKKTNRSLLHEVLVAICFPALFLVETPHEGSGCLSVFSPVQRKAEVSKAHILSKIVSMMELGRHLIVIPHLLWTGGSPRMPQMQHSESICMQLSLRVCGLLVPY